MEEEEEEEEEATAAAVETGGESPSFSWESSSSEGDLKQ